MMMMICSHLNMKLLASPSMMYCPLTLESMTPGMKSLRAGLTSRA